MSVDRCVVVDVETTGLDCRKDQIIEIALLEFGIDPNVGPVITRMYSATQDPGMALPDHIAKLTGLTSSVLKDTSIDWGFVRSILSSAEVVIAHNADFDRSFLEARSELQDLGLHWACSIRHVPWRKMGLGSMALNYLAADHGFVNPFAHRALFDCATTFRLISPHIGVLVQRSYEREIMVWATGAPFEVKDVLKSQGYRWDAQQRCWNKTVLECDLEEERSFLSRNVYAGTSLHREIPRP